jgi:hypothetical protein
MTQDLCWYSLDDDGDGGIWALQDHKLAVSRVRSKHTSRTVKQTRAPGIRQSSDCVPALRSSALLGTRQK